MPRKVLKVGYRSQRDNKILPDSSCNTTALAMALSYFGVVGSGRGQLEDELRAYAESKGWSVYQPDTLVKLANWKGVNDSFTTSGKLQDIKTAIDNNQPCVTHGYWTRSGHIVTVVGYETNDAGVISKIVIHDPFGEWFRTGYDRNEPGAPITSPLARKGELNEYFPSTFMSIVSPENSSSIWLHRFSK